MTAEEYYIQKVQNIITSVVEALQKNPQYKFSQTEIYFFSKWWVTQNDTTKNLVKQFVKEKRLEFVLGGWVSNDEACPTYEEIIMNIMTGHEFLKKELGITPKIAWIVDGFGHSAATPELYARMGFESLFFARVGDEEKEYRKSKKLMEFEWQPEFEGPSGPIKSANSMFTHVTHEMYQGGCDIDMWIYQSNRQYTENFFNNKIAQHKQNVENMIKCFEIYASHYKTRHVLFTLGTDFAFQFADLSYKYIDGIVKAVNDNKEGKKFKFIYSTVQEYVDSVQSEKKKLAFDWPKFSGDFFPMNGNYPGHYWTGYFTSRANFKRLIR